MKPFIVLIFFFFFFILFVGATLGETDLTPHTPPSQGGNYNAVPVSNSSSCSSPYTVQSGDTLSGIASGCGLTVQQVLAANPAITDPNMISVGQQIIIPGGSSAALAAQEAPAPVEPAAPPTQTPAPPQEDQPQAAPATQGDPVLEAFETASADFPPTATPADLQPGSEVEVSLTGFPPNTVVQYGIGRVGREVVWIGETTTDANGNVTVTATIPEGARARQKWTVTVSTETEPPLQVTAEPFTIAR